MNEQEFEQLLERVQHTSHQAPDYLAAKIQANLPTRAPFDRVFSWFGVSLWRGVLTALLPLAIGFSFGLGEVQDLEPWIEAEALMYADTLEEYDYDEI